MGNGRYKTKIVKNQMKKKKKKVTFLNGEVGYRSPYLSHAKRALYHLSYIPFVLFSCAILYQLFIPRSQKLTTQKARKQRAYEKDKRKNHIAHHKLATKAQSIKMPIPLTTKQK